MKISDFDYYLPKEYIAQEPAEPRDSARLMILDRRSGRIEHRVFRELREYLSPGDLLVLNNTRVIPARLNAQKRGTGGRVEILLLGRLGHQTWRGLVGGRSVGAGTMLELTDGDGDGAGVYAEVKTCEPGGIRVFEFSTPADSWLGNLGNTPLPPYIRHFHGDPERYQTVYARWEGSAAAPTAGLHFTSDLLLSLRAIGLQIAFVTLHIGLDTFKPIDQEDIATHPIHTEWAELDSETATLINKTRLEGRRVIAVGTTVVRTLETAARKGGAGTSSCGWSAVAAFADQTSLFITPGFRFRAVDAMITNFHLPRSTLIVLVSAFAGVDRVRQAYASAIERGYRFYSFGDAMLIT